MALNRPSSPSITLPLRYDSSRPGSPPLTLVSMEEGEATAVIDEPSSIKSSPQPQLKTTNITESEQTTCPTHFSEPEAANNNINCNGSVSNIKGDASKVVPVVTSTVSGHHGNGECCSESMGSSGDMCRICHCEGDTDTILISPCICTGSLKFVHQGCLQQWIKSSDTRYCELCKFEFLMKVNTRPFKQWEKLDMTPLERRKIICSVSFHVIALTCVIWSLYVLIERTTEEIHSGDLEWPFWTKLIVVAVGFTGGVVFMYVQCRMYTGLCRRWRSFNRSFLVQSIPADLLEKAQKAAKEKQLANQQINRQQPPVVPSTVHQQPQSQLNCSRAGNSDVIGGSGGTNHTPSFVTAIANAVASATSSRRRSSRPATRGDPEPSVAIVMSTAALPGAVTHEEETRVGCGSSATLEMRVVTSPNGQEYALEAMPVPIVTPTASSSIAFHDPGQSTKSV